MRNLNLDLTPLFRSTVGFDRLNDLFETVMRDDNNVGYPPYNIAKLTDNHYSIIMAVAGFRQQDLIITTQKNLLTISGKICQNQENHPTYLYQGIASRAFERKFNLADYMQVTNAKLVDGILSIELIREIPEEIKPKQIVINNK